jgi:membrane associated rhomboid family serine protease
MFGPFPPVTRAIILANIAVFLLQQVAGRPLEDLFALWPFGDELFQPWQLVTYGFLHDGNIANFDIAHIFFNMFALYMFGGPLEEFFGSRRFAIYYLISVISAAATQLIVESLTGTGNPVVGASGGVFGLLLAFAWFYPRQRLLLIFPLPIPMPAWLFVTLFGAVELVLGLTGAEAGVAHFAHLGGMLGGGIAILYWRTRGRFGGT